jgi:hypothetical protein
MFKINLDKTKNIFLLNYFLFLGYAIKKQGRRSRQPCLSNPNGNFSYSLFHPSANQYAQDDSLDHLNHPWYY